MTLLLTTDNGQDQNATVKPFISVIVPLRNSGAHINGLIKSLVSQDYGQENFEVIFTGSEGDQTWDSIEHLPDNFYIREAFIPPDHTGRDSNIKRNWGTYDARDHSPNRRHLFAYTDAKIRHLENWLSLGVAIMQREEVESVAGVMHGTLDSVESVLGMMADKSSLKRNPEFGTGYLLTKDNFGSRESLPITANWIMTEEAFELMGGFDERFTESYEDYSAAWRLCEAGGAIWCTSQWVVYHKHRTEFKKVFLEYARSARGAGDLFNWYPDCPFAIRRFFQSSVVMAMIILAVLIILPIAGSGNFAILAAMFGIGTLAWTLISIQSWIKVEHWYGLLFPTLSAIFVIWFAFNFFRRLWEHFRGISASDSFLQTILHLIRLFASIFLEFCIEEERQYA